jgi:hypothetical protein
VRQGDAVTTYKAQGVSKTDMIRLEGNRSLLAMANREDLYVAFTRHRADAEAMRDVLHGGECPVLDPALLL